MKIRIILTAVAVLACISSVLLVRAQRQELSRLEAERQSRAAQLHSTTDAEPSSVSAAGETNPAEPSSELLRLRGEVTRLNARKRELSKVPDESERLNQGLANTPPPGSIPLPPGYIRKSEARLAGYNTPEDTIQSFLYAVQQHDFAALLRSFTPAMAQSLESRMKRGSASAEEFFKGTDLLPGLRILNSETRPDGTVELQCEVAPGAPTSKLQMQKIDGEWKLATPL
jgi:hypothetical protein